MASIAPFSVITLDGSYELETRPGRDHLLTLKGGFGSGTVTMTSLNNATGTYTSVTGGEWTDEAEIRFAAPSEGIRLTVTGSTTPTIAVNLQPLYAR